MPHERSQYGCWTCRIRKKKCDERDPTCWACDSRGITCHGYGPKPEWMDGGEKEKKEAERLKRAVRESLKQKKALMAVGSALSPQTPNGGFQHGIPTPSSTESNIDYYSPQDTAVKTCPLTGPISVSPYADSRGRDFSPTEQEDCLTPAPSKKDFEATMLMNYLDHVFPLQFNCYNPPVIELGRGWLLALLTRTKPLYHAALALSCLFMHSQLLKTRRSRCTRGHWDKMNKHHALAFQELQAQISASSESRKEGCLKEDIEILACIVQLISFELLKGGTESWNIHLQAASSIVPALTAAKNSRYCGSASHLERIDRGDQYPVVDEIACNFLVGTFIWFDILATASTRSKSFLENNFEYLGNIKLEEVMGCENWVMTLIAKISLLEEWKRDSQRNGRLSIVELSRRGSEIEKLLGSGLARQTIPPCAPVIEKCPTRHVYTITRIFAYAALTYLHTVVSGAHPELAEIKASVSMTTAAFSNLPVPKLLQNLVWPYCITGCMASSDKDSFFGDLIRAAGRDEQSPGNQWKAFEVIRECWRLRESKGEVAAGVDWTNAMISLGFQVLLV